MGFNLKKLFGKEESDEYVEIDLNSGDGKVGDNKVVIKPFILREFDDINGVLNALREGFTITVIDIKPLKSKDVVELKRAITKIKKTVDAIEGKIAGFGENIIIATPQFADIHKATQPVKEKKPDFLAG